MKYVFIEKYRAEFSIKVMCRVLTVVAFLLKVTTVIISFFVKKDLVK